LIALAVAMGIGFASRSRRSCRDAHDGVIDLHGASWLASANYVGYLSGAVPCTLQRSCGARLRWPAVDAPTLWR
jgi:hypothetical protein